MEVALRIWLVVLVLVFLFCFFFLKKKLAPSYPDPASCRYTGTFAKNMRRHSLPLSTTGIRTNNHTLANLQILSDPSQGTWFRIQVIDRDIEEPLNLTCM